MAFTQATLVKGNSGFTEGTVSQLWIYTNTNDTLATILASGYFDDAKPALQVGDFIFVRGSDSTDIAYVSGVSPTTLSTDVDKTSMRFTTSYYIDGKGTLAAWPANSHPKAQLVRGYVRLVEAPDSSATTYTVLVQNATGTVSMTDTLTFTEGTDAAGAMKVFTPVTAGDADEILRADILNIITAGTTTTAGAIEVTLEWEGIV